MGCSRNRRPNGPRAAQAGKVAGCFGLQGCGSGVPLLRPVGSSEPLLCRAEGVIGAPVCSMRSGGPGPAIARTRGGLLGRWAAAMVCCGGTRVDTNDWITRVVHVARTCSHCADKTSHTTPLSSNIHDCTYRDVAAKGSKYCILKLRYLLNH